MEYPLSSVSGDQEGDSPGVTNVKVHEACLADMTTHEIIITGSGTGESLPQTWRLGLQTFYRGDVLMLLC